jgi:general stress protein YciG
MSKPDDTTPAAAKSAEPKTSGMSVREAGQKGGETVKKKYGPEFYEMIGRKGGQATKAAHGHAFYEAIGKKGGKKGGEATRDRYGPTFYEEIGQKGGQKVKALIEQGKRAAEAQAAAAEHEKKAS